MDEVWYLKVLASVRLIAHLLQLLSLLLDSLRRSTLFDTSIIIFAGMFLLIFAHKFRSCRNIFKLGLNVVCLLVH